MKQGKACGRAYIGESVAPVSGKTNRDALSIRPIFVTEKVCIREKLSFNHLELGKRKERPR